MDETISATQAARSFAKLLRGVRQGRSYVVTIRGRPVARLAPAAAGDVSKERARAALLARLRRQPVIDIGPWRREELYEDDAAGPKKGSPR
jgi:prevent-host-death family protein